MTKLPIDDAADVWERAIAEAMEDPLPIEYERLLDPYRTDEQWLPHLAAGASVDLWFDDWSVEKKREMVAQCEGRSTLYPGEELASLKGTIEGARRYLWFVDAEIEAVQDYPARFVVGQSSFSSTPINHPPFRTSFLVKINLPSPFNGFGVGLGGVGKVAARTVDKTPILRAKQALRIAKDPDQEWLVSFSWLHKAAFADALPLDGNHTLNAHVERTNLVGL
ncbi:MAG: phage tail protein I [Cohaesibacter sp.]|nr:phage tail protein I [Cohaesibacter sp.]